MVRRELRRQRRRRRRVIAIGVLLGGVLAATIIVVQRPSALSALGLSNSNASFSDAPASAQTRASIVALAQGQVGYTTDPSGTYCNKFSAYWFAGSSDCGNSNRDEQWCADFAAGAWRLAGAPLVYQFINGDQNSSSASFYEWRVRHHTWRLVGSGYVPQLGDRTVYVLNAAGLVAQHVAVVVSYTPGERGPNAVNGDGDHTGFSRVENQTNEYNAAASGAGTSLPAGCVSPSA